MEPQEPEPEFQEFYHQLLNPLSIVPRRAESPKPQRRRPEEAEQAFPLAKVQAAHLCSQVSKLLAGSGLAARVSPSYRLRLAEVIVGELRCSWREPPAEPKLSYRNYVKLQRRLESYVLLCSEQLFLRYLHLLVTMPNSKGIFTESAILSRLVANLARDCTVFLTSPAVYRCLLKDFLALLNLQPTPAVLAKLRPVCPSGSFKLCPIPWPHSTGFAQVPCSRLNLNYLVQLSRPPEFLSEPPPDPVNELKALIRLKWRKPLRWLSIVKYRKATATDSQPSKTMPSLTDSGTLISAAPRLYSQPRRSRSMPSLREGWKLEDELGLPPPPTRPLTPLILAAKSKQELAADIAAKDLRQKVKKMTLEWPHRPPPDSGLPPLLGVVTRRQAASQHLEELQRTLKSLQEEEASGQWYFQIPKRPPLQPQPVTIALKLRNQMVVQTATVRVSERYFLDTFHVQGAGVLYNHLAGELDSKVIEEMDVDRFVGGSTKEVYEELMSRVSTDHFRFDQGPLVEPAADKDWSSLLSSATLHKEKQFRIINPNLAGFYSRKTRSQHSSLEATSSLTLAYTGKNLDATKSSFLNLLRNFVSVSDYFKYLRNQESDYLHTIFQMYEEDVPVVVQVPVKESVEIPHPPPLLEDEEPDFVPGEWDWHTVLEHSQEIRKVSIVSLQKRLEQLWSLYEVPEKAQLDMIIKYSSNARLQQLPVLLKAWEQALKPIQARELLLGKLEWFERQASDPNRFFRKTGLDIGRLLEENELRSYLHRKLNLIEAPLVSLLQEIEAIFGEPLTFRGRRYLDKMRQDKVEMLYWLQQQRRIRRLIQTQKTAQHSSLFNKHSSLPLITPGNTPLPTTLPTTRPNTSTSFPSPKHSTASQDS
ncbi:coiled-coil domain-containing protein 87 [Perognathus longimembris pacificus]|uniref:coiled-coil domain-containing protein 87 n=1 Tax=Perognathus longimembris pacificus TaxID=214514 RepID=UPI002019964A|nr:coiled-coil domain-containing protein 87 [Perognathus longimembris pacificus]